MQALEWLGKRQREKSLMMALISSLIWTGVFLLGVFFVRKSGNETPIVLIFVLAFVLFMNPLMHFDLPAQIRWLLSLPIPHKVFVHRAVREELIKTGFFALALGLVIVVIAALRFPINLFGAVTLLLTLLLTWVAIVNLLLMWFSLNRQKGWKLLVAYGAIGFTFLLGIFAVAGISIAADEDLKTLRSWSGQIPINLLLFPFSVHVEAMRALREGVTIATLVWVLGYAHFVALTFLWVFKCAPDFCEAMALEAKTTLHGQRTISETLPQRVCSRGFGKRERTLAWLSWLAVKRRLKSGYLLMPTISLVSWLFSQLWLRALPINWRRAIFYLLLPHMAQILVMSSIIAFAIWLSLPNMLPTSTLVALVVLFLGIDFLESLSPFVMVTLSVRFGLSTFLVLPGCFTLPLFVVLPVFVRHPMFWWLMAALIWLLCIPAYRQAIAKLESGEVFIGVTFLPHLLRSR